MVSNGVAPLTEPRPIGVAHAGREMPDFAGMRLTKELTDGILRVP